MIKMLKFKKNLAYKIITCLLSLIFSASGISGYAPAAHADVLPYLPAPAQLVTASPDFKPVMLKGLRFFPDDPLKLRFIIDEGNTRLTDDQLKAEADIMIRYFLSALTIPVEDMWVNLSPYEQDRVISDELGLTDLGRDLLAQDYILKQLASSLTYPESPLGKKYWDRVYQRAREAFGTTKIPVNTYNKVWIVPDKTEMFESGTNVFVTEASLKVMLEADYQAASANKVSVDKDVSQQAMRELIIPEITREVNQGRNFAYLRQIHTAIVLAVWFKTKLKDTVYNQLYIDKKKIKGIESGDPQASEKIWQQYVDALKKGVYNYLRKEVDSNGRRPVKRRYYSGGYSLAVGRTSGSGGGNRNSRACCRKPCAGVAAAASG